MASATLAKPRTRIEFWLPRPDMRAKSDSMLCDWIRMLPETKFEMSYHAFWAVETSLVALVTACVPSTTLERSLPCAASALRKVSVSEAVRRVADACSAKDFAFAAATVFRAAVEDAALTADVETASRLLLVSTSLFVDPSA